MASQPTLFEDPIVPFSAPQDLDPRRALSLHSAVFLSMRIDNPPLRRRSVHKFTSEDLVPALKSSLPAALSPPSTPVVQAKVRARIPTTTGGELFLHVYQSSRDDKEHLAIVFGNDIRSKSLDAVRPGETETDRIIRGASTEKMVRQNASVAGPEISSMALASPPLVRVHSQCMTGETFHSFRCDCGEQLDAALELLQSEGRGVILYLPQEGRGIGLTEKLKAYNLQDLGHDTVTANLLLNHPAEARTYDIAAAILKDLGLDKVRLLTNNPDKIELLQEGGIEIMERVGMKPRRWEGEHLAGAEKDVDRYLRTKVLKMRHILDLPAELADRI